MQRVRFSWADGICCEENNQDQEGEEPCVFQAFVLEAADVGAASASLLVRL
jgi:hypothetical protein